MCRDNKNPKSECTCQHCRVEKMKRKEKLLKILVAVTYTDRIYHNNNAAGDSDWWGFGAEHFIYWWREHQEAH